MARRVAWRWRKRGMLARRRRQLGMRACAHVVKVIEESRHHLRDLFASFNRFLRLIVSLAAATWRCALMCDVIADGGRRTA